LAKHYLHLMAAGCCYLAVATYRHHPSGAQPDVFPVGYPSQAHKPK